MHDNYIEKIIISETELQSILIKLGDEITEFYESSSEELLAIGLLRGSFIFMADLVRLIRHPLVVDFMAVSSYGNSTESSENIKIIKDLDESVAGKNLLLIEDIIDTGLTLKKVYNILKNRNPNSIKICTLLSKPARRKVEVNIDFCGIEIPDEFVCGYGIDFAQRYRNLPYIGVYNPRPNNK